MGGEYWGDNGCYLFLGIMNEVCFLWCCIVLLVFIVVSFGGFVGCFGGVDDSVLDVSENEFMMFWVGI